MHSARNLSRDDFILLEGGWSARFSLTILEAGQSAAVVVHRLQGDRDYYYLYTRQEAENFLRAAPPDMPVEVVLDLHEWRASPALGAGEAATGDRAAVILEDGRPVGYVHPQAGALRAEILEGGRRPRPGGPRLLQRNLQADFPASVALGAKAVLRVKLSRRRGRPEKPGLEVLQPAGSELDVIVQARRGFEVEGEPRGRLVVGSSDEYTPLRFTLRAIEPGEGDLRVIVFRQGAVIGYLRLTPQVGPAPAEAPSGGERVQFGQPLAEVQVETPDLSLHIEETWDGAGRHGFVMYLSASDASLHLNLKKFGPVLFQSEPGPFFGDFYRKIEGLPLTSVDEQSRVSRELEGWGVFLFENLFPPEAQELLWSLRGRIRTVFIQSAEPWVPWELCRLTGMENGRKTEGAFFCEAFEMTRWLPGTGIKPALHLSRLAVVVPASSGLPYSAAELEFLLGLAGNGRQVERIPARYLDLFKAFSAGSYDGWHFSGHGAARGKDPNQAEMILDEQETLTPIRLSGEAANLGRTSPLVFLNACQIGQGGMSLTDAGGWARQFLAAGAGAFIGAHWAIYDRTAYFFARELYSRLLGGLPVGRAVREARLAVKPAGDPTWLAYTVFAHPLARIAR